MMEQVQLSYDRGTVIVAGGPTGFDPATLPGVRFDERTSVFRAQGRYYRSIVETLIRSKQPYKDDARGWANESAGFRLEATRDPFPHQREALAAWTTAGRRGVVVLPTGTGKTFVAILCIAAADRPALVVTPTIDLMNQWYAELKDRFDAEVGLLGGGYYDYKPLTVTTYDSAYIHLERWGNKFGLLVFDECHHLPGPTYAEAAIGSLAPFRLGLTATPERPDGADAMLPELIGPIVYRKEIRQLSGDFLAEYRTERVYVDLTPEEAERYRECREIYRGFVADRGISFSGPGGWQRFIFEACRHPDGAAALQAYREQKRIERSPAAKFLELERLLIETRHGSRALSSRQTTPRSIRSPASTSCQPSRTRRRPRNGSRILERFHNGEYSVVVTSQVLNEGVDVPAAGVGIVLSGSGSTRENVQRLGRILRKYEDKQAVLYEVVAKGTAEEYSSDRRRQHGAFEG